MSGTGPAFSGWVICFKNLWLICFSSLWKWFCTYVLEKPTKNKNRKKLHVNKNTANLHPVRLMTEGQL